MANKKLTLIGADHYTSVYDYVIDIIREINPDCITLEKSVNAAADVYKDLKDPLKELIRWHKSNRVGGEFTAGVVYAREKKIPLYCIDECYSVIDGQPSIDFAIHLNMLEGNNSKNLMGNPLLKHEPERSVNKSTFSNWTRRNRFMAFTINYHFLMNNYKNILHIGGKGHYDENQCIPLQDMVIADSIEIIDAVLKTKRFK